MEQVESHNIQIRPFDDRRHIAIAPNKEKAVAFSIAHFLQAAKCAIAETGRFTVALSGGSTPEALYRALVQSPNAGDVDWKRVFLFWSDERCVPPNDPGSNYGMALVAGIAQLPIPKTQIFRMQGEEKPEIAAYNYERELIQNLPLNYVMLGMGEDGHTASLFPKTHALHADKRLVVANYVPQKKMWRLTFTFEAINSADQVVLYVLGSAKQKRVKEVFSLVDTPNLMPVQKVGSPSHPALWILDGEAAALLKL